MPNVPSTSDPAISTVANSSVPESTTPFETSKRIKPSSLLSSAKTSRNEVTFILPKTFSGESSEQASNNPKPPTAVAVTRTTTEIVKPPKTSLPTSTSIITDQPESTFSSPVVISVFNHEDGKTSLNTPAFVTVFSTSTGPDGGFVTFTHDFANPSITASSDSRTVVQTG
ncbi:hypothetical protein C0993_001452 [Termitomyces sp. T159_Od127]|nr:hypothetical protein C0993_001452 [Termitomyces sp. T159_Od127]